MWGEQAEWQIQYDIESSDELINILFHSTIPPPFSNTSPSNSCMCSPNDFVDFGMESRVELGFWPRFVWTSRLSCFAM